MAKVITKKVVAPKIKSYVSDFVINMGPVAVAGRLASVTKSESKTKTQFNFVSPEGNSVERVWRDIQDGTVYDEDDLDKTPVPTGTPTGSEVVVYTAEEIKAAKTSTLPKNVLDITVHPAAEVSDQLFSAKANAYVFDPDTENPKNVKKFEILAAALENNDYALVGVSNVKGHEGFYRLGLWRGHVVLIKQLYPNEVNEHEVVVRETSPAVAEKLADTLAHLSVPFDGDTYRSSVDERLVQYLNGELSLDAVDEVVEDDDLLNELESLGL
jgi:hypothetical protein